MAKKKLSGPRIDRQSVFSLTGDALGYLIESKAAKDGGQLHHVALLTGGTKWFDDQLVKDYKQTLAKAKDPEKVKRLETEIQAFAWKESQ